jgi:hypothetical protein
MDEGLVTFCPLYTRGACLVDGEGVRRFGFDVEVMSQVPLVGAVLEEAQVLAAGR